MSARSITTHEWNRIARIIQRHINGINGEGLNTFTTYYGLSEVDELSWEYLVSDVMPRGREEIRLGKLGLVGLSTHSLMHSLEEAVSAHREWIKDRKYMTVVRCCRDICFATWLSGIVNGNAEIENARVQLSGSDEAKLQ